MPNVNHLLKRQGMLNGFTFASQTVASRKVPYALENPHRLSLIRSSLHTLHGWNLFNCHPNPQKTGWNIWILLSKLVKVILVLNLIPNLDNSWTDYA